MSWYSGICLYFSNSACQAASPSGGSAPVTSFHSVMLAAEKFKKAKDGDNFRDTGGADEVVASAAVNKFRLGQAVMEAEAEGLFASKSDRSGSSSPYSFRKNVGYEKEDVLKKTETKVTGYGRDYDEAIPYKRSSSSRSSSWNHDDYEDDYSGKGNRGNGVSGTFNAASSSAGKITGKAISAPSFGSRDTSDDSRNSGSYGSSGDSGSFGNSRGSINNGAAGKGAPSRGSDVQQFSETRGVTRDSGGCDRSCATRAASRIIEHNEVKVVAAYNGKSVDKALVKTTSTVRNESGNSSREEDDLKKKSATAKKCYQSKEVCKLEVCEGFSLGKACKKGTSVKKCSTERVAVDCK